jgi:hypothetical protein
MPRPKIIHAARFSVRFRNFVGARMCGRLTAQARYPNFVMIITVTSVGVNRDVTGAA